MDKEKMKRARDDDDDEDCNAKKRDVYGINLGKENQQNDVESEKASSSSSNQSLDSNLALGVFDFPWLKDGVVYKTEDYLVDFEDKFSSSLENHHDGVQHFSEACCYFETPETSKVVMEDVWQPFDVESDNDELEIKASEDVDCIWSSLVNENKHEEIFM